ncbi:regulator of sigma D [Tamilnaduibacter salinus]|uniref:Regulator of sigma D n=1 Tax=Tamilnaduibacter salinus TaxID=1484056 RepID=A0A2A2I0I3_9GAMM|nr:sigma D regulator [Tamilnaduibacter salinus]PAV24794.1 Rsd/AlgQ family anti-sigma factor [Tamilnaduibacter salinus]PVY76906.1 regulator of sigma D [Tamilnaduibacter salinus]
MLEDIKDARERWGGVSELIDRWLRERQELIVQYCDITGMDDFSDLPAAQNRFHRLCEILLDYVSAGHFEVYEQLVHEARDFDDGGVELIGKVYPRIQKTTENALSFNDRVNGDLNSEEAIKALMPALSELGEQLETRFELEDFLIEHLHNVHAEQVMSSAESS